MNPRNTERWCFEEELKSPPVRRPSKCSKTAKQGDGASSSEEEEEEIIWLPGHDASEEEPELDSAESVHSDVEMSLESDSEDKSKGSPKKAKPGRPAKASSKRTVLERKAPQGNLWKGTSF